MKTPPDEQAPGPGPDAAAKPSEPGPAEPRSIGASILPQRLEDRARHPDPPEAPGGADDGEAG